MRSLLFTRVAAFFAVSSTVIALVQLLTQPLWVEHNFQYQFESPEVTLEISTLKYCISGNDTIISQSTRIDAGCYKLTDNCQVKGMPTTGSWRGFLLEGSECTLLKFCIIWAIIYVCTVGISAGLLLFASMASHRTLVRVASVSSLLAVLGGLFTLGSAFQLKESKFPENVASDEPLYSLNLGFGIGYTLLAVSFGLTCAAFVVSMMSCCHKDHGLDNRRKNRTRSRRRNRASRQTQREMAQRPRASSNQAYIYAGSAGAAPAYTSRPSGGAVGPAPAAMIGMYTTPPESSIYEAPARPLGAYMSSQRSSMDSTSYSSSVYAYLSPNHRAPAQQQGDDPPVPPPRYGTVPEHMVGPRNGGFDTPAALAFDQGNDRFGQAAPGAAPMYRDRSEPDSDDSMSLIDMGVEQQTYDEINRPLPLAAASSASNSDTSLANSRTNLMQPQRPPRRYTEQAYDSDSGSIV
eukprot:Clim_evm17s6 gene=Clim_evmTU17s6